MESNNINKLDKSWCIQITKENRKEFKNWVKESSLSTTFMFSEGAHYGFYNNGKNFHGNNLIDDFGIEALIPYEEFQRVFLNKEVIIENYNYLIPILNKYNIK